MADTKSQRKLRALIIVESDMVWSSTHPQYATVAAFKEICEELHVLVLSDASIHQSEELLHPEEKLFVYQFKKRFILFRISEIWKLFGFHLVWQGVFRADFIISFSEDTAFLGYMLGRHYDRDAFVISSTHVLEEHGLGAFLARFALKRSKGIFLPGVESVSRFAKVLAVDPHVLHSVPPSLDLVNLKNIAERYDFKKDHPEYSFFVSGAVYNMETLNTLLKVHTKVAARFPRASMIIIADESIYDRAERRARRAYGVFVYKMNDKYLTYLKGTSIYLALSVEQDVDTMMLTALALQLPVVAGNYGIAKEIYFESKYTQFLCDPTRVSDIVNAMMILINDQYVRTEYGLNNPVLSGKVKSSTVLEYAQTLHSIIDIVTRPLGVATSATVYTGPTMPVPNKENKI